MRIDSHQHFWQYTGNMSWITPEMGVIRRDFTPAELAVLLGENQMDGCVTVQVDQTDEETRSLIAFGEQHDFIKGLVGWVDLKAEGLAEKFDRYKSFTKLKGFRHILQGEEPGYMLHPGFINGIQQLGKAGFTYDILVFPKHLKAVIELLKQCPDQPFVIDHLAKPDIKNGAWKDWSAAMKTIAQYRNVYCKVSGMVTEADWQSWKPEDMTPYLDTVSDAFGADRLMFGSDWPVCLVAASYAQTLAVVARYFSGSEQSNVLGENARRFYKL